MDKQQFILNNYYTHTTKYISFQTKLSVIDIENIAKELGIIKIIGWSDEEDSLLFEKYHELSRFELKKLLLRSDTDIRCRSKKLKIQSKHKFVIEQCLFLGIIKDKTNRIKDSKLYGMWSGMLSRCRCKNNSQYHNYGGRNIQICEKWLEFVYFAKWAVNNGYEEGLTIDRIDNNGNYCPENCRWATIQEQSINRRNNFIITAFGETKTLSEWVTDKRCVVKNRSTLKRRILSWKNPELAIIKEIRRFNENSPHDSDSQTTKTSEPTTQNDLSKTY